MGLGILLAAMTYPMGWIGAAIWNPLAGVLTEGWRQTLGECLGGAFLLAFGYVQWFVIVPRIARLFRRQHKEN